MAQQEMTEAQKKALQEKLAKMSPEELKEFQKQQCIFCQIISGKVKTQKIYEDEKSVAILDINPANVGHILLLPKDHYAIMPQVPEEEIGQLFTVAKHLSQALLKGLKAQGTNIFVANGLIAGQRAQHFMIHVVPRFESDKVIGFQIPQKEVTESDLKKLKEILTNKINETMGIKKKVVVEKPSGKSEEDLDEPKEEIKEEPAPEPVEEKEKPKPKKETKKKTIRKAEKKKPAKKKSTKKQKKEESSLDDIAELFK